MKKLGLYVLAIMFVLSLAACSHDSDDDDEDLVDKYDYTMNYTFSDGSRCHIVYKFSCVLNDDGTYTARRMSCHYFSKTNSVYASCTGSALCTFVKGGNISADFSDTTSASSSITGTVEGAIVTVPVGTTIYHYYYF